LGTEHAIILRADILSFIIQTVFVQCEQFLFGCNCIRIMENPQTAKFDI